MLIIEELEEKANRKFLSKYLRKKHNLSDMFGIDLDPSGSYAFAVSLYYKKPENIAYKVAAVCMAILSVLINLFYIPIHLVTHEAEQKSILQVRKAAELIRESNEASIAFQEALTELDLAHQELLRQAEIAERLLKRHLA